MIYSNVHRLRILSIAGMLIVAATTCVAQTRAGFQVGVSQDQGEDSEFPVGIGTGWSASGFVEIPLMRNFRGGIAIGFDRKVANASTPTSSFDSVIEAGNPEPIPSIIQLYREYQIAESFLHVQPYLQAYIFPLPFFVQAGFGASFLVSNNISQSAHLIADSGITFTNGTTTQTLESGSSKTLNSLQFSLLTAVGYDFSVLGAILSPMVTFDSQLSNTGNEIGKIFSVIGSLKLSFVP